jgi:hypothetical protein
MTIKPSPLPLQTFNPIILLPNWKSRVFPKLMSTKLTRLFSTKLAFGLSVVRSSPTAALKKLLFYAWLQQRNKKPVRCIFAAHARRCKLEVARPR